MRVRLLCCLALNLVCGLSALAQDKAQAETASRSPVITGYAVSFTLSGLGQRQLTFLATPDNRGTFRFQGRTTWEPQSVTRPAVWDRITPTLISFAGEAEFPLGNCCRETGTLIFKGSIALNGVITGHVVFVTNTPEPTNPTGFVTRAGEFTATPLPIVAID